jgi:ABC-2 type transport system ATP-binding protein
MKNIISIQNFSKSFGKNQVIKDLSFDVEQGEIFAFLGANGSGKTTTIRTLLGMLKPDSGKLLVNGRIYTPEMSNILGYLPEERGLYLSSPVFDTLVYFAELKGVKRNEAKLRAEEFLKEVELWDKKDINIGKLSSGQQQKIQLGITIINKPELLILDEPTKGLDPVNRELFLQMFLNLNKQGSTIIFSTHQMEETEKIANRLVMIKSGERVLYGDVIEVKSQFGTNNIQFNFRGKFPENKKLYTFKLSPNFAEITPNKNVSPKDILEFLLNSNIEINRFEVSAPSLNEIFIKVSKTE